MRPVRVVVAGSVDDGKSTLLGRLLHDAERLASDEVEAVRRASGPALNLAFFTDGLVLEREQGITVDVATRHLVLGARRLLLADAPGHAELLANLATGASTADAALLLVDAVRGPSAQTARHLAVIGGLGVPLVLACVNKLDAVDDPRARAAALDTALRPLVPPGVALELIPVSALAGDNVVTRSGRWGWYAGPTVAERLEALTPTPDGTRARAVVQLSSADGWAGLVVAGAAPTETDTLRAWPGGARVVVLERSPATTSRLRFDRPLARGTLLTGPEDAPQVTDSPRLLVTWLGAAPLVEGARLRLVQLGRATEARVRDVGPGLAWGQVGWVSFALDAPTWLDAETTCRRTSRAVLVDEGGATVGGARLP